MRNRRRRSLDADDRTVILSRSGGQGPAPLAARPRRILRLVAAALAGASLVSAALWIAFPNPGAERTGAGLPTPAATPRAAGSAPSGEFAAITAGPEEILAWRGDGAALFRLRGTERVFVVSFANLDMQAAAMNRIAVLLERAGAPRDRVLDDSALAALLAASGTSPEALYVGHNYRLADLELFFGLAQRDGIALNATELSLGQLTKQLRGAVPAGPAALLTITRDPRAGDAQAQRTILEHELSHGMFFTDPRYAAVVMAAWREVFGERERTIFRRWLAGEGYDPANEELMANEMQAYLLHTPDVRFFGAERLGISDGELGALRENVRGFIQRNR